MTRYLRVSSLLSLLCLAGCGDRTAPAWGEGAALEAPEITSDALWLTWPEASDEIGVTGYEIAADGAVLGQAAPADERRWLVDSLTEFTDVSLAVVATDEAGNRSAPLEAVIRTLDITSPVPAEGCEVTGEETEVDGKVTQLVLGWCTATDNDRVDRFEIRQPAGGIVAQPDDTSIVLKGEDLRGIFTVRACDPTGNCAVLGTYKNHLPVPSREMAKMELDLQIAESAGILAALADWDSESVFGSGGFSDDLFADGELEGIGGLIGAKGVEIGSGGLGMRGSGLGGGGTAEGLGGLGTRGYGGGGGVAVAGGFGGGSYDPPSATLASGGDAGPLRDHVSRRLERVENCYRNALRESSGLSGTLTVSLTADAEGAVTVGGVGGVDDAELIRCASTALRGRLTEAPGEPLTGAFGVTLSPGSSG